MSQWIWQKPNWPDFRMDHAALMGPVTRSHQLLGRLYQQIESLGLNLGLEAQLEALAQEAVQTSAIEGEIQDPQRLRSSLARRLGLPAGGLSTPRSKEDGLVDLLLDATGNLEAPLIAQRLFSWHAALFPTGYSGLRGITVGAWRPPAEELMKIVSGPVGRERVHYIAPPAGDVPLEMERLFTWWEATRPGRKGTDFILRSGVAHYWFVAIHPFEDGNGRIARALADLALAQGEGAAKRCYSVSSAIMEDRVGYYAVLDRTSRGDGDLTEWLAWYLNVHAKALEKSQQTMARVSWAARIWQNAAKLDLNKRQRKALAKLVERGPGGFEGGLTRRKYVAMTGASEATAARDLTGMVEAGLLISHGSGRATAYELNPDFGQKKA